MVSSVLGLLSEGVLTKHAVTGRQPLDIFVVFFFCSFPSLQWPSVQSRHMDEWTLRDTIWILDTQTQD